MYYKGQGVMQDYKTAIKLFKKACDKGDAQGCYNLGVMYANGYGVRQNYKTAKEFLGEACDMGLQVGCDGYAKLNRAGY